MIARLFSMVERQVAQWQKTIPPHHLPQPRQQNVDRRPNGPTIDARAIPVPAEAIAAHRLHGFMRIVKSSKDGSKPDYVGGIKMKRQ